MSDPEVLVRADRHIFFDTVRATVFGGHLTQEQVDGITAVLDEWEAGYPRGEGDLRKLGYILGTTWWETGRRMVPVHEGGRGGGHAYGRPDPQTGQIYYGRGQVQLTWKANYAKMSKIVGVDLVANPDKALDPKVSAKVLIQGMLRGLFTGKRLSGYFKSNSADWAGARHIVNGTDHAHDIAAVAQRFHAALEKAKRALPAPPMPQPQPETEPMKNLGKGYRTLALNGGMAVGLALLQYVAGVDWSQYVDPKTALAVSLAANALLRFATTGPVGEKPAA